MAEGEADMIEKLVFWEHAVETLGYFSRQMEEYFKGQGYKTFLWMIRRRKRAYNA